MSEPIYVSADTAAEMLRERGQEIADLEAQIVSMMRVWDEHDKIARATNADLATAIEDGNRSREIIYAMAEALGSREGEHNIDLAKRVAQERDEAVQALRQVIRLLDYIGIELAGTEFQRLSERILQFYREEPVVVSLARIDGRKA